VSSCLSPNFIWFHFIFFFVMPSFLFRMESEQVDAMVEAVDESVSSLSIDASLVEAEQRWNVWKKKCVNTAHWVQFSQLAVLSRAAATSASSPITSTDADGLWHCGSSFFDGGAILSQVDESTPFFVHSLICLLLFR
jgi:hypothetical protein